MVYFLGRLFVADALWASEAKIKTTEGPENTERSASGRQAHPKMRTHFYLLDRRTLILDPSAVSC